MKYKITKIAILFFLISFELLCQKITPNNQDKKILHPVVIKTEYFKEPDDIDSYNPYKTEHSVIKRNGEVVKAENLYIESIFNEGLAIAVDEKNGTLCYVDENLKKVIEFRGVDAEEISVSSFFEGFAWIKETNQDPILINKFNQKQFVCRECVEVKVYSEGLAAFKNKNGNWGFMDQKGNTKFLLPESVIYVSNFSEGLAQFFTGDWQNGIYFGYINTEGAIVINPRFIHHSEYDNALFDGSEDFISSFKKGVAKVHNNRNNWRGDLINKKGEIVRKNIDIEHIKPNLMDYKTVTKNGKEILIDKAGKTIYQYPDNELIVVEIYNEPGFEYIEGGGKDHYFVVRD
jgi:hypothetical protein